jgi:D-arabinose 1-dehydrogenase-like Zn-dependent alcohol dehydrogenase
VVELGSGVEGIAIGQRVGVPWLGHSCGHCPYCAEGRENLRDQRRRGTIHVDLGKFHDAVPILAG